MDINEYIWRNQMFVRCSENHYGKKKDGNCDVLPIFQRWILDSWRVTHSHTSHTHHKRSWHNRCLAIWRNSYNIVNLLSFLHKISLFFYGAVTLFKNAVFTSDSATKTINSRKCAHCARESCLCECNTTIYDFNQNEKWHFVLFLNFTVVLNNTDNGRMIIIFSAVIYLRWGRRYRVYAMCDVQYLRPWHRDRS